MKKRILTLALALAAVCALAVTAMADGWDNPAVDPHQHVKGSEKVDAYVAPTCTTTGTKKYTCTGAPDCTALYTETVAALNHVAKSTWEKDADNHWHVCNNANCPTPTAPMDSAAHTWTHVSVDDDNHKAVCSVCGYEGATTAHSKSTAPDGAATHKTTCSASGCTYSKSEAHTWAGGTASWTVNGDNHECTCSVCGTVSVGHTYGSYTKVDDTFHKKTCTATGCGKEITEEHTTATTGGTSIDASNHYVLCTVCNSTVTKPHAPLTLKPSASDPLNKHQDTCPICNYQSGTATPHSYDSGTHLCVCGAQDPSTATLALTTNPATGALTVGTTEGKSFFITGYTLTAGAGNNVSALYNAPTYVWYLTYPNGTPQIVSYSSAYTLPTTLTAGTHTLQCVATSTLKSAPADSTKSKSTTVSWTLTVEKTHNVSVTIPQNIGSYVFADTATANGASIYSQIVSGIPAEYQASAYFSNLTFTLESYTATTIGGLYGYPTTGNKLANMGSIYFAPSTTASLTTTGTWTCKYTVSYGSAPVVKGNITINVTPYTGVDILYTATLGQSVNLSVTDFQNFWREQTTSSGNLTSVRINAVSGVSGALCYNHKANEGTHTNALNGTFYVSPSTVNQKGLSNLSFVPSKVGNKYNTGSVTIYFTATGTNRYSSAATSTANGTIVITYTDGEVQAINYNSASSYISLNGSDFTAVYKTATKTTAKNPSFTIRFLEVPSYGTLYRYTGTGSFNASTAVQLTKQNIDTYDFSNGAVVSNSIDKVVYVPGYSAGIADSVRYAVYSGSTLLYVGTVTFNSEDIVVEYFTYGNGTYFDAYDFFYGSTAMYSTQYVSFGTPSSGTLYKNYSAGKGTAVSKNDYFAYSASAGVSSLSSVVFMPKANFSGTVEIPFYGHTTSGSYVSGTVKIYCVAKAFSDVTTNRWSTIYINRLYATGVVGGTSATTFSPYAEVKYGEALKMIMLAAGYPKQAETGGKHWASNYLNLAYRNGIVSSTNIDLNAAANREAIAEIAAKALGLSKASYVNAGVIGPADSTNGYVYALYNAGIVGGEVYNGTSYFYGSRTISREEISKIICNIMDYEK